MGLCLRAVPHSFLGHICRSSQRCRLPRMVPGESPVEGAEGPPQTLSERLIGQVKLAVPHVVLLVATALYLFLGAVIFVHLELPHEIEHTSLHVSRVRALQEEFMSLPPGVDNDTYLEVLDRLTRVSFEAFQHGIKVSDFSNNSTARWNLPSALFFTTTLLTSIGYGHLVPLSPIGQVFCICYALSGIPLTLVTIADLAKFLAEMFGGSDPLAEASCGKKVGVLLLLLTYMTLSAVVYSAFEEAWSFLDSFYFCLISLLTVGFGDLYPVGGEEYMAASIFFIFLAIESIHAWGRGLDALSLLKALKKRQEECWYAYVPHDAHRIPYIDCSNVSSSRSSKTNSSRDTSTSWPKTEKEFENQVLTAKE